MHAHHLLALNQVRVLVYYLRYASQSHQEYDGAHETEHNLEQSKKISVLRTPRSRPSDYKIESHRVRTNYEYDANPLQLFRPFVSLSLELLKLAGLKFHIDAYVYGAHHILIGEHEVSDCIQICDNVPNTHLPKIKWSPTE